MTLRQWLIFLLCFTIEIRAKGSNPASHEKSHSQKADLVMSEPENCHKQQVIDSPCTVKNSATMTKKLQWGEIKVYLLPSSSMIREVGGDIRLVHGRMWVFATTATKVQTVYGDIELRPQSVAWMSRQPGQITLRSHRGLALVQVKGESKFYEIPYGFETIIEPVTHEARAHLRTPAAISFKDHLREMKAPFPKKDEYLKELDFFSTSWREAMEGTSLIHGHLVFDQATLEKRRLAEKKMEQSRLRQERAKYRDMLVDRTNR